MSQMFILLVPRITECLVFGDPTLKEEPQDVAEDTLTLVLSPMRRATCSRDQITMFVARREPESRRKTLMPRTGCAGRLPDCRRYPTTTATQFL